LHDVAHGEGVDLENTTCWHKVVTYIVNKNKHSFSSCATAYDVAKKLHSAG